MSAPAGSLGDVQRQIRLARRLRVAFIVLAAADGALLTAYAAAGLHVLAIGLAFALVVAAVVTALQSHVIRRLQRVEALLLDEAQPGGEA